MACTIPCLISLVFNIILLIILTFLIIKYFNQKNQVNHLVKELSDESLEHYLKEIKKRGFEFTLKPKKK